MKIQSMLLGAGLAFSALGGCDDGNPDARAGVDADAAVATNPPASANGREQMFDRAAVKAKGCPLLRVEDVAASVDIAATAVRPNPALDCLYAWDGGTAMLGNIRVHGSVEAARRDFARTTEDLTAAEMQAGADSLEKRLEAEAAAGSIDRRAAPVGGALARSMAGSDVTNAAIRGIGELASHDGNRLKVLVGNVTFDLAADRGDEFDLELSRSIAQRVVRNLERL